MPPNGVFGNTLASVQLRSFLAKSCGTVMSWNKTEKKNCGNWDKLDVDYGIGQAGWYISERTFKRHSVSRFVGSLQNMNTVFFRIRIAISLFFSWKKSVCRPPNEHSMKMEKMRVVPRTFSFVCLKESSFKSKTSSCRISNEDLIHSLLNNCSLYS